MPTQTPHDRRVGGIVLLILIPLAVVTGIGLVVLWPTEELPQIESGQSAYGTVVATGECVELSTECTHLRVLVTSGPDEGVEFPVPSPMGAGAPEVDVGDKIVLQGNIDAPADQRYSFQDFQRQTVLWVLAAGFALAVVGLARWRGVAALAGLAASVVILLVFILPAILQGSPPLWVATVGAAAIAFVTMLLAHGPSLRTAVALLGTLLSLTLTAVIGTATIALGNFSGLSDESTSFLIAYLLDFGVAADPRGLLLAGLVIGALGVLDDVTITQTAAVAEVRAANPSASRRSLFAAGLRVGKDHVAATVNTLVLAYAGAAMPLLMLLLMSGSGLGQVISSELVAQEVVRTLVGALGIVAAVPVTTALAAGLLIGEPGYAGHFSSHASTHGEPDTRAH